LGCPGSRGVRDPGKASPWKARRLHQLQFWCGPFIDADQSWFLQSISAETAPPPQFRRLHKAAAYGIAMQIAQLLHPLLRCADVEVIVSRLPYAAWAEIEQLQLRTAAPPLLRQNTTREP